MPEDINVHWCQTILLVLLDAVRLDKIVSELFHYAIWQQDIHHVRIVDGDVAPLARRVTILYVSIQLVILSCAHN